MMLNIAHNWSCEATGNGSLAKHLLYAQTPVIEGF